jgi:phosphohistidine phosphatase
VKTLYLLRHAKSSWDDPGLEDLDRPLAPRGRRASKRIARHVRQSDIAPELVLCSPSVRARETLEAVRAALGDPMVRFVPELYAVSGPVLLRVVRQAEPGVGALLVVGHNPGLHELAVRLTGSGDGDLRARLREKLPTGALVTLVFEASSWPEVEPGAGKLVGYVVPRELG